MEPIAEGTHSVVLRISGRSESYRVILAEGLTYKEAQARAKRARKSYLYPNTVEVR